MKLVMRSVVALLVVLGVLIAGVRWLGPGMLEARINTVAEKPPYRVSDEAAGIHRWLRIVDLHADPLLWGRDLLEYEARGHVDLPRLLAGNVHVQTFGVVTKSPEGQNYERTEADTDRITSLVMLQGWPRPTWSSLRARALHQAERLRNTVERSRGRMILIRRAHDLERVLASRADDEPVVGALLALEGMHALEGDLAAVDEFFAAGFRMMAPTHFFDNELGGSSAGVEKGGLTDFGAAALGRVEELGGIVDLAHASPRLIADFLARATRPVVVSHTGVKATCPGPRNLSDAELRAIAAGGGLIGIGYWKGAVCGIEPADIVRAMRHVRDLVGVEHVALGSDFDGATHTAFDTSGVALVTEALHADGFSRDEIRAITGDNAIRFIRENL